MASIEKRNDRFRLIFYYSGRRYTTSLKTADRREAEAAAGAVERCLMHLEQGVLELPEGADLVAFVLSGGKRDEKPSPASLTTLTELEDRYLQALGRGAIEANSLYTLRIHLRHLVETLGARFPIQTLKLADRQRHIEWRTTKRSTRNRPVGPVTLRKEIASLGACWNWGVESDLVTGTFPSKGLKYPKTDEKAPFQTWDEIEREIARGGLTEKARKDLWACLFLTLPEINEFLAFVKATARHGFLYPMLATAAHTGARRSELLQMRIADVDFERMTLLVREKKRVRGKRSTRRVPISSPLAEILQEWLTHHPGGQPLFCHASTVERSKKRSQTTGHLGQRTRAKTLPGRAAGVHERGQRGSEPLTASEVHDHMKRTLAGSRWEVLKGWHVLRHSFISLCASRGIDQRFVDEWVGHTTEEMRRRYRHLYPSLERAAITSVFGTGK